MSTLTKVEATPGPWKEGIKIVQGHPIDHDYRFIDAGLGFYSKENTGFGITGYISEADAKILAAAPELLEACEDALHHHVEFGGLHNETALKLQSAINKARGI